MKIFRWSFLVALVFSLFSMPLHGAPEKKKKAKSLQSKEVSFDEILVQGKHHFSDEAVVTVENDKVLDALLEIRKDFKDRIKKSARRN